MASFNKVILVGNLTRDPETRYTPKGTAIAQFGLAINHKWRNEAGELKEEVTFVEVESFGKTAENIAQYMRKGPPLLVEGRLKLDTWEDKQTNAKRSKLKVIVETAQFLGGKRDDAPGASSAPERPSAAAPSSAPTAASGPDDPPVEQDDVPF